jgi:hypothetical protein
MLPKSLTHELILFTVLRRIHRGTIYVQGCCTGFLKSKGENENFRSYCWLKRGKILSATKTKFYSKQGLWTLFLMCAFPLHFWTIILVIRDFSWVIARTNLWDGFGVASYGLLLAIIESVILFLVTALLGLLVSRKWNEERRITLLSVLYLVTAFWAIISQLYFLAGISIPQFAISFMAQSAHPTRVVYVFLALLIILTTLLPTYLVLKSNKGLQIVMELIDRLSLLTMFYLFLDVAGLIIIFIRNVF